MAITTTGKKKISPKGRGMTQILAMTELISPGGTVYKSKFRATFFMSYIYSLKENSLRVYPV
jgi:hypothetical protein